MASVKLLVPCFVFCKDIFVVIKLTTNSRYSIPCTGINCDFSGCMEKSGLKSKFTMTKTVPLHSPNMLHK